MIEGLVSFGAALYKAGMNSRLILRALFTVVMMAMLVRAVIPVGYMPDATSDSPFYITICTASGSERIAVDENMKPLADQVAQQSTSHTAPQDDAHGHATDMTKDCVFAMLQHVSGFIVDMSDYAHHVHEDYRHAFAFVHDEGVVSQPRYLRPPSHGPPVVV